MRSDRLNSVPVTVITGFLGSGKTTVLNRLLRAPDLADTAVIINEFGEVSLDHLLIEQAIENAVLLKNGCICCTVRGDILDTLEELFRKRETGELPWFRRIAIETTGLADPAPVVHTLIDTSQALPPRRHRGDGRCDACARATASPGGSAQPDRVRRSHSADQDRPRDGRRRRMRRSRRSALSTPRRRSAAWSMATSRQRMCSVWVPRSARQNWLRPADAHHHHHHDHTGIASIVLRAEAPIPGPALALWLDSLLSLHGADVLRLKGIVRIAGVEQPLVLQAVHHVLHGLIRLPPRAEAAWAGTGSEIVVIQRGLPEAGLRASFAAAAGSCDSNG